MRSPYSRHSRPMSCADWASARTSSSTKLKSRSIVPGAGGASGVGPARAGSAIIAAITAAVRRLFMEGSFRGSIEEAHGERLAAGGIEHLRTHRLAGAVGGDR